MAETDVRSHLRGGVSATVDELPAAAVDRLMGGRAFWTSRRWLACAERLPGHRFQYLHVTGPDGELAALLPCQLVTGPDTLLFYDMPRMLATASVFGGPDRLTAGERSDLARARAALGDGSGLYPALVAACPSSYCSPGLDPRLDAAGRRAVLERLAALLADTAAGLGCRCWGALYLPAGDPDAAALAAAVGDGAERGCVGADCVIDLAWPDFDGYVASVRQGRRVSIRRERRAFAASGLGVTVARGAAALTDDLVPLQAAVRRRYGLDDRAAPLSAALAVMRARLDDEVVVFWAERAGRTAGFVLFLEHEGALYSRVAGFDHPSLRGHDFCYFNLVHYEPLEWALRRGLRRIHLGMGSYAPKVARGCRLRLAEAAVAFSGPLAPAARSAFRLLAVSELRMLRAIAGPGRTG
jgi:uncharacterized protein